MTIEEAQEVIKNISYKDGTKIKIRDREDRAEWELTVSIQVPHVLTRESIPIVIRRGIYYDRLEGANESFLIRMIMDSIKTLEKHETEEWFKYKGLNVCPVHENEVYKPEEEDGR